MRIVREIINITAVVIVQPILALVWQTVWYPRIDFYHAIALSILGTCMVALVTFCNMVYNWLYVDEVTDFRERKKDGSLGRR